VSLNDQINAYDVATKTEGGYYQSLANNITKSSAS